MRKIKIALRWFVASAIILLVLATAVAFVFKDQVIEQLVAELNKNVQSEINVESIDFTLLQKFPNASVVFNNISAPSTHNSNDTLFHFQKLFLSFNLIDVYHQQYKLLRVDAEHGFARLHTFKDGSNNYTIWKADTLESSENFELNIEDIGLVNVGILWENEASNQRYKAHVDKLKSKGTFLPEELQLALYGDLLAEELLVNGNNYLNNTQLNIDLGLEFLHSQDRFQLSRGIVKWNNSLSLNAAGWWQGETYAFQLSAPQVALEEALGALPPNISTSLDAYTINGQADIDFKLERKANAVVAYSSTFKVQKGEFVHKASGAQFADIHAVGSVSHANISSPNTFLLQVDSLSAVGKEGYFSGNFRWKGIHWKSFTGSLQSDLKFKETLEFLGVTALEDLQGTFNGSVQFKGSASKKDSLQSILPKLAFEGMYELKDLGFTYESHQLEKVNAQIAVSPSQLEVTQMNGDYKQVPFKYSGTLKGYLNQVLSAPKPLVVRGKLYVQEFSKALLVQEQESSGNAFELPQLLDVLLQLRVDRFTYENLSGEKAVARLQLTAKQFAFSPFKFQSIGGSVQGKASIVSGSNKQFELKLNTLMSDVDVSEMMAAFDNFKMQDLTSEHISGKADLDVFLSSKLDSTLQFIMPTLFVNSDITLRNGRLRNYEPLATLVTDLRADYVVARMVHLDDFNEALQDISFETLSNNIQVKDETVFIPGFEIKSSALTMGLEGTHTFDNAIDYRMYFNLKEVLLKRDPEQTEYGHYSDDGTGNQMIFRRITGTVDNPVFEKDKEAAKAYAKTQTNQEWKTTRSILKEELGLFKNDTSLHDVGKQIQEMEFELDLGEFGEESKTDSTQSKPNPQKTDTSNAKGIKKLFKKLTETDTTEVEFEWEEEDDK